MKIINGKNLWVSSSFTERFGSKDIKPAKTVLSFMKLEKLMTDTEIKAMVGESTPEDVAAFIKNPPEGTDDGYWNIFYVAGCVVLVYWLSDYREWYVDTWNLDGGYWLAGDRVFSRNWHSDTKTSELSPSDTLTLGTRVATLERQVERIIKWADQMAPPEL